MRIEIWIESERDFRPEYFIHLFCDAWQKAGHEVRTRRLDEPSTRPDVAVLHVDRSDCRDLAARITRDAGSFPVVNGAALDIRKRRVSRHLVTRRERCGPVIVKSDLNCFGRPERKRSPWPRFVRLPRRADRSYRLYADAREVPRFTWLDRKQVVERFLPERDGDFYVLRNWVFFGDRDHGVLNWSREPIVKAGNVVRNERDDDIPEELRTWRRELGFDYGKFDWVLHEGRPVLLDANKTVAAEGGTEHQRRLAADLADGIGGLVCR